MPLRGEGGGVGPLMANAIKNFHFDYVTTSLSSSSWLPIIFFLGTENGEGESVQTITHKYLSCFILLGVIKDQERNPEPLDVFKSQRVLRARVFQVQIFDSVVVPIVTSSVSGQAQDDYHSRTRRNFKMYTWSTSSILMMSITDIETLMFTGMFLLLILSKLKGAIFLL